MRIGVIGPTWPDAFATHIIEALSVMGHVAVALGSSYAVGGPFTTRAAAPVVRALPGLDERLQRRPLKLYGPGFPRWVGETPLRGAHRAAGLRAGKARVFGSAAAVLNNLHPAEISSVNARLFEAAGCGTAVLTEFRPALPELFAVHDEVLALRDFDELVGQATWLLADGGLSAKLGDAVARRAHAGHAYEKRLAVMLEKLS